MDFTDTRLFNNVFNGYILADYEDSSNPIYLGKLNKNGNWYIEKIDQTAKTMRYVKGDSDYPTNWTNRATLTYDYITIFNR